MPPGLAEFMTLAGQYGLFNTLTAAIIVVGLLIWLRRSGARNHVETSEANSIGVLAKAITELAAGISEGNKMAAKERQENLLAVEKAVSKIEGMMNVLSDNTKATRSVSTHIHELADHIPQIKTDLQDLQRRAASIQAGFTGALDERFGPLLALLAGFGGQLNTLSANALTAEQSLRHIVSLLTSITNKGTEVHEDALLETETD